MHYRFKVSTDTKSAICIEVRTITNCPPSNWNIFLSIKPIKCGQKSGARSRGVERAVFICKYRLHDINCILIVFAQLFALVRSICVCFERLAPLR